MKKPRYPKYTHGFIDRFGKPRFYLRVPGRKKRAPLPGLPWSPEFMAAREAALNETGSLEQLGASRTKPGTVNAAIVGYYQSGAWLALAKGTRASRRAILERFREKCGALQVREMPRSAIQRILNNLSAAASRNWKKALRGLIDYCRSLELISTDPLAGLTLAKMKKTGGFHTWSEDEIAQYEGRHARGTRARLALVLLLQTGHARSDVVRMGRQHARAGKLSMRRQKTNVPFDIPLLPALIEELALHPKTDQLAFLVTELGNPFTPAGFGNWFRERCDEANLRQCAAHGLRKAAAVRHALNGATAPELMAWFGWKTIGEAQRYIEEANRVRLAENAGAKLISGTAIGKPEAQFAKNDEKALK
jgi:integrase